MNAILRIVTVGALITLTAHLGGGVAADPTSPRGESSPLVLGLVLATPDHAHMLTPAIDILTARLTREPGLVVVERRELDVALKELERSAGSPTDGVDRPLELGTLLKADLIGEFDWYGASHRIAFRLDSVRHGVRLLTGDYPYQTGQDAPTADLIMADIQQALLKLKRTPTNAVVVTFMEIRSVEPGLRTAAMAHTASTYIRERLLAEDNILLAVRDDLLPLQREQSIRPDGRFPWSRSRARIEGDMALHKNCFLMTLWMDRGAGCGDDRFTVEIDPMSARAALDDAVNRIVQRLLQMPPSAAAPTVNDAARLLREADQCSGDWQRQYRLLATAHLLNPADLTIAQRMLEVITIDLHGMALAEAQRVKLELLMEAFQYRLPPADVFDRSVEIWSYLASSASDATPALTSYNRQLRQDCRRFAERVFATWQPAFHGAKYYRTPRFCPCQWETFLSEAPETALAAVETWFSQELMTRVARDGRWTQDSTIALESLLGLQYTGTAFRQHDSRFGAARMRDLWNEFLERLSQHADPYVRLAVEMSRLKQNADTTLSEAQRRDLPRPYDPAEKALNELLGHFLFASAMENGVPSYAASMLGLYCTNTSMFTPPPRPADIALLRSPDWTMVCDLRACLTATNGPNELSDALRGYQFALDDEMDGIQTKLVGDQLWLACAMPPSVLVMRLNLAARLLEACWMFPFPWTGRSPLGDIAPGDDATYVGTDNGIYVLPGAAVRGTRWLDNCAVINEEAGLPPGRVTAIARLGDRLYVGLGRNAPYGVLGEYDLRTRHWKTLASSESRDTSCPLNREIPFRVTSLTPSADGAKIFFVCEQADIWDTHPYPEINGIWKIDPKSGQITKLWHGDLDWAYHASRLVSQGAAMLMINRQSIMSFDPIMETSVVLNGVVSVSNAVATTPPPDASRAGPGPTPKITGRHSMIGTFRNALWWWSSGGQAVFLRMDQPGTKPRAVMCDMLNPDERRIVYLCTTPHGVVLVTPHHVILLSENPETEPIGSSSP